MNKSELVMAVAAQADLPKAHAERAVSAFLDIVSTELKNGNTVNLSGFGQFGTKVTQPRTGRNPQTGQTMQIAAGIKPVFKPGKALKDAVK